MRRFRRGGVVSCARDFLRVHGAEWEADEQAEHEEDKQEERADDETEEHAHAHFHAFQLQRLVLTNKQTNKQQRSLIGR